MWHSSPVGSRRSEPSLRVARSRLHHDNVIIDERVFSSGIINEWQERVARVKECVLLGSPDRYIEWPLLTTFASI